VELPVFDGLVTAYVLADAVVDALGWNLLERFLRATVYPRLRIERHARGVTAWRDELPVAHDLPDDEEALLRVLHGRAGWPIFLQELGGRPDWSADRFYDARVVEDATASLESPDGWITVEVSRPLADVETAMPALNVVATVGGTAIGVVTVPV